MPIERAHGSSIGPAHAADRPRPVPLINSLGFFVPSYLLAVLGYLGVNMVAGRSLGTPDFGAFVVIVTVTNLIGQLGLLGVHRAGVREGASASTPEALRELRSGVRAVLLLPLPAVSLLTVMGTLAWRWGEPDAWWVALLSGVLAYLSGYQILVANFLRGLGEVRIANLLAGRSGGALIAVAQAVCVLIVVLLAPEWGLVGVLGGYVIGYALPLVWVTRVLSRRWGGVRASAGALRNLREVMRRDWRFALSQAGGYLNSFIELWLAASLLSAGATSLFAAAQRLAQLLLVPNAALQAVFSPAFARLVLKDEKGYLQPLVRAGATVASVAAAVAWLPMVVAPTLVLGWVYGDGFEAAAIAVVLLSTGYFLNSASGPSTALLSMAHHEGDVAVIKWCTLAARAVAGVICASLWGFTGLAASACAVMVLGYATSWWLVRKRLAISTLPTLRPALSVLRRVPS